MPVTTHTARGADCSQEGGMAAVTVVRASSVFGRSTKNSRRRRLFSVSACGCVRRGPWRWGLSRARCSYVSLRQGAAVGYRAMPASRWRREEKKTGGSRPDDAPRRCCERAPHPTTSAKCAPGREAWISLLSLSLTHTHTRTHTHTYTQGTAMLRTPNTTGQSGPGRDGPWPYGTARGGWV